jgi:hypothetical protein
LNTSRTVGAAIGLASLATIAANRTAALLGGETHTSAAAALTAGYARAFEIGVVLMLAAIVVAALTIPSLRGAPPMEVPTSAPGEPEAVVVGNETELETA